MTETNTNTKTNATTTTCPSVLIVPFTKAEVNAFKDVVSQMGVSGAMNVKISKAQSEVLMGVLFKIKGKHDGDKKVKRCNLKN